MRRLATLAILPCSVVLFVAFSASAGADEGVPTTPTIPPPIDEPPPTSYTPPPVKVPKLPRLIKPGVTIGGLLVGGFTKAEARELVLQRFDRPVTLVVSPTRKVRVPASTLGASLDVKKAVSLAVRVRQPGFRVPLAVHVARPKLTRFLARLARETDREPVDASITLKNLRPVARKSSPGRQLKQVVATRQISLALRKHLREPIAIPYEELEPEVTEKSFKSAIVIERGSNRLLYFKNLELARTFHVATGQAAYPTPIGDFEIVNMQRNPWWYPPQGSAWAEGEQPVPPGPGNPLGTRWMGISSPYVGIHGTPDAASVGYSASHGCIRMLIPEAEWLFNHVDVGTPVFIVSA
ncbi:MAG TPA: L,D-transpeptidase family protein [Gaiella sp.]|nr:L,D-transpeptidase family protein [Gaiella sp.]